ncbi:hypothetical protein PAPYR_3781 [Paratrimastix pyriformis]|uniref:Uncharacterized protein n=1 Tax=Paratrimastix pyriformis TaxID=342808 RepID=A0ABQ8ULI9_9EUKA|nr:hypothetical protein PAPYR_3781 [Paratrimastix pyriformis]
MFFRALASAAPGAPSEIFTADVKCVALLDAISEWHKSIDPPPQPGVAFFYDLCDSNDQQLNLGQHLMETGIQAGIVPRETYRVVRQSAEELQVAAAAAAMAAQKKSGAPAKKK